MKNQRIQSLNPNIASDRVKTPYPHAMLLQPSDAVALVLPSLDKGDFPILCEYKGDTRRLGNIDYSALQLSALLRLSPLRIVKSPEESVVVKTNLELMEAML